MCGLWRVCGICLCGQKMLMLRVYGSLFCFIIEVARDLAAERLGDLNAAKEMVRQEQPLELEAPCVHLIFHAHVTS